MKRFEKTAGDDFDNVVAVSKRDQQRFIDDYGWHNVDVIDTAVDTNYFKPSESVKRSGVVFVGSMDWPPNVDGIQHFVSRVWPKVKESMNGLPLTIVGRNPPAAIKKYDGHLDIKVTGTVADIRPYLASNAVGVVPLFSGGGTRLKIFEYMAMKLPVVSTSLGAEGLGVRDNEHLLIRDDDQMFADALIRLCESETKRQQLSSQAYELVCSQFSSESIGEQFEECCQRADDNWKAKQG